MRILPLVALAALTSLVVSLQGCISPLRVCAGCTWKAASFTGVPTGNIESASLTASVKHVGKCPQRGADNCTETLDYSVKCAVGSGATVTLPMLVDAADTNPNRTAKLVVKKVGGTPVTLTGVVASGPGMTTLPATPCEPPVVDPYTTLPDVQ